MLSEYAAEIKIMHLEDQLNRMNLVLAEQVRQVETLGEGMAEMKKRLKSLEEGNSGGGPSEVPPDGVNR